MHHASSLRRVTGSSGCCDNGEQSASVGLCCNAVSLQDDKQAEHASGNPHPDDRMASDRATTTNSLEKSILILPACCRKLSLCSGRCNWLAFRQSVENRFTVGGHDRPDLPFPGMCTKALPVEMILCNLSRCDADIMVSETNRSKPPAATCSCFAVWQDRR
jgi:hypothetical protein